MTTAAPVRLAGRTLKETRHICAFFHSKEEQNKVLMPFFKEGFERGEKLFHVVDGRQREGKRSTNTVLKERGAGSDPLGRRVADVEGHEIG